MEIRLEKTAVVGVQRKESFQKPREEPQLLERVNSQEEGKCGNPLSHGMKQGAEVSGPITSEMAMDFKNS